MAPCASVRDANQHSFLTGWGAPAAMYRPGLPHGWTPLGLPGFRRGATLEENLQRLADGLGSCAGPVVLGGHSMGGALAILAAAAFPERVAQLVLVSPAGLPIRKPVCASALDFARQLAAGLYPLREIGAQLAAGLRAPRAAVRLAQHVRALDLTAEMRQVRAAEVPVTVIGCTTDTLVTPARCRQAARLLAAQYHELPIGGGHTWMFRALPRLAVELRAAA
jgi:pimeloyl-ACP methyl ester carboxylesterase